MLALFCALLATPYAASQYEQANALSCCENPPANALWVGLTVVAVAVFAARPLMVWLSERLYAASSIVRLASLALIGAAIGAVVGWSLFGLTLLETESGQDLSTWGVTPGALVGVGAAIGWWLGTEILGPKKVRNG
ncbi:hypothetical protein [Sphingomonas sp. URHD0057]|uniref:hypothetical protein n=1 Tax=Sphingomonas sp. URHD0057 TaxID=1380389 RepID=UPI0012DDB300|nr:hypothetical protein [Sphingomonas sp. URHD0057]